MPSSSSVVEEESFAWATVSAGPPASEVSVAESSLMLGMRLIGGRRSLPFMSLACSSPSGVLATFVADAGVADFESAPAVADAGSGCAGVESGFF
jgi:hypothetical protein